MIVTAFLSLLAARAPFATAAPVDCGWSVTCFAHNLFPEPEPTTALGCEARYTSNDDVTLKKKTMCYHKVQLADDEAKGKERDANVAACHVLHHRVLPWLRDRCNELCDKHYLGKEANLKFVCDDARRSAMNDSLGSYYVYWVCFALSLYLLDVPVEYVGVLAVVPVIVFVGLNQQIMDKFF